MDPISSLGVAVVVFASTNIDDVFVLMGFYAEPRFRSRDVVAGQYIGIAALFAASVVFSLVSLVVPEAYVGLLGLVPIAIGGKQLFDLRRGRESAGEGLQPIPAGGAHVRALTVAAVTIANGGDNIGVYTPPFATRTGYELALIGVVFAVMTALWCAVGHWMVEHRTLGAPIRRYGHRIVPLVLIALGVLILHDAGSFELLGR